MKPKCQANYICFLHGFCWSQYCSYWHWSSVSGGQVYLLDHSYSWYFSSYWTAPDCFSQSKSFSLLEADDPLSWLGWTCSSIDTVVNFVNSKACRWLTLILLRFNWWISMFFCLILLMIIGLNAGMSLSIRLSNIYIGIDSNMIEIKDRPASFSLGRDAALD